jgi:cytochrome P450
MDEFADSVIADRRSESVDELRNRSDLLSKIMSTEDASGNVVNPSDSELRDFVLNFMIAGRDTTANLLTWMLYELICHPDAIRRIREECDEVLSDHSPIEFDHVHSKLKYLDAVVLESLRLHTPVPKDPKLAVSSDRLPDGTFVPAGAHVMYAPWIMGRLPSVWGDDALEWRPERFLNQPQPNPYKFPVFQAGPRICLGRNMALLEAKTCICVLLKNLDFELAPDFKIKYRTTVTLPSDTGLWLVATPRKCV